MNTEIRYYGYDILKYYCYVWQNEYSDYSWQIYIAWLVVLFSIFMLIYLSISYTLNYYETRNLEKKTNEIYNKYYEKIKEVLLSDKLENHEIIEILGRDIHENISRPELYIPLITQIHMETKKDYFPNMNDLCSILNVTAYCENNLLKNKSVFTTLQFLCINQIIIMEGRLANYVNHKDVEIRMMARLCYIFCAHENPYKYLLEELDTISEIKCMFLHYIFVWMKNNNKSIPDFDTLCNKVESNRVIEFLQNEKQLIC